MAELAGDRGVAPGLELTVVPCEGWRRGMLWDETGLAWINQSPNMRRLTQAILYPGVGIMETTNISVGRGSDTPFELFGAPWIDAEQLAAALNTAHTPGIRFVPRYYTPDSSKFAGERCGGVDVIATDLGLNAVDLGMVIAVTLRDLYPDGWETKRYPRLLINDAVHQALVTGASVEELQRLTRVGLDQFLERRSAVLLYEE